MTVTSAGHHHPEPGEHGQGLGQRPTSCTTQYTAAGNRLYQVDRKISYTYPNQFFTQTFDVTIPPVSRTR